MKRQLPFRLQWLVLILSGYSPFSFAQAQKEDFFEMQLEELMQVTVVSATGVEESLFEAPAAMLVLTAKEIQQRGYSNLVQILEDLPGFDVKSYLGNVRATSYQRGYRTPFTQRTLFMINGRVENDLWSHNAHFSTQYPLAAIKQIEVLYGPASAMYGPNAFLGVINVITQDPTQVTESFLTTSMQSGSFGTRSVDFAAGGRTGELSFVLSAKVHRSDEPGINDYSAQWGFMGSPWQDNQAVWGELLAKYQQADGSVPYRNPSETWGLTGEVAFGAFKAGTVLWQIQEGYGPYYAHDRVQPEDLWSKAGRSLYVQHRGNLGSSGIVVGSELQYRSSRLFGDWAEAEPDWNRSATAPHASYISFSQWNTFSDSWRLSQNYDWQYDSQLRWQAGLEYERKTQTKAFDICRYWKGAFCSTDDLLEAAWPQDPWGKRYGSGIFHSTDPNFRYFPGPASDVPDENTVDTTDQGGFVQLNWEQDAWRALAGVRYDYNSLYGQTVNPRVTVSYHLNSRTVMKALYGTAFQEPAPSQLWGGWAGRRANPDLKPEKAQNLELIVMHQQGSWLHDLSLYQGRYRNVIKEEAENAGERTVTGLEYRGRFSWQNPLGADLPAISHYLYYSWTQSISSIMYDHSRAAWLPQSSVLGDIAPHKLNVGLDWPLGNRWHLHLRSNYVSRMQVYSRNPLRQQDYQTSSYWHSHLNLLYKVDDFDVALRVMNVFNSGFFYTGGEQANSGIDFSERSKGFRSSLVPSVGRNYQLMLTIRF